MNVEYEIVYNDGHTSLRSEEACFGKLKDFKGNVAWEKFADPKDHGGLKGIRYHPEIRCKYDAVRTFSDGVDLFKRLIDEGCNPDMAFVCSGLLRVSGSADARIQSRKHEDSEHTVLCHTSFSLNDYKDYVGKWQVNPPKNSADKGKTYREVGKYVRGNCCS